MKYKFANIVSIATLIVGIALALFIPENVLSVYGALRSFVEFMASLIPSINNLAKLSAFPEVTKLVLSWTWAIAPIVFIFFLYDFLPTPLSAETLARYERYKIVLTLSVYIFLPAMIFAAAVLLGDLTPRQSGGTVGDAVDRSMSESRLWLGVVASCISLMIGFILTIIVLWTRLIPFLFRKTT
jgi:hypothetical protein